MGRIGRFFPYPLYARARENKRGKAPHPPHVPRNWVRTSRWMNWAERLHEKISVNGGQAAVAKVAKGPLAPLATPDRGASEEISKAPKPRCAYHFRLRKGEGGGTYLTDAQELADARAELVEQYGDRLALVVRA